MARKPKKRYLPKQRQRKALVMEDNTFPIETYAERLMIHPRTFLRKMLDERNPSYGFSGQLLVRVDDVADRLGCDYHRLKRIMNRKDEAWTMEQACKAFSITKPTFRRYNYPKFLDGHTMVRYSREVLMATNMQNIEL